MYTRESFPYEQYLRDVYQASDDDIGEGLDDVQRDNIYRDAVVGFRDDMSKQFQDVDDRKARERLATEQAINEFDGAR